MDKQTKNILRGVGSLVDIAASNGLRDAIARRHIQRGVASHFGRVSLALNRACKKYTDNAESLNTEK